MSMEPGFQLSSSFDDSPRNFLPAGLFLEGANGHSPFMRVEFPMPLSPMNGPRATPFQFNRGPLENVQFYAHHHTQMMSPRSPHQWQPLNRHRPGTAAPPPAVHMKKGAWASALLDEDEEAIRRTQTKLNSQSFTAAVLQKHPTAQPPTLYPADNIENFEPGSPHWNDSVPAYPNTPNFKQWLKDERMTPKKNKATNKLGPERYKSLRVSGNKSGGKSAHESQGSMSSKRGEKLGTFYDPGFNTMDKASFRTGSHHHHHLHRTANINATRPWTVGQQQGPQQQPALGSKNKPIPGRPAINNSRHTEKKQSLYKTELCTNWTLTSSCTYGNKCHFAHGIDDLKPRTRLENFKTQPCCDPAREGSRRCLYGSRCNYCHPGEAIRRPVGHTYYDRDYYKDLAKDFGDNKYPFGIYV